MCRCTLLLAALLLISTACGSSNDGTEVQIQITSTTEIRAVTATTMPPATTTTSPTTTITTTPSIAASCESEGPREPEEVWNYFVAALNEADMIALKCLVAQEIEWSWDSDLFAIHQRAQGAEEALEGFEDLISRNVTFETQVLEVEDSTVTAETVFNEPALAEVLGGGALLQTDLVTIRDGLILTWTSTANQTVYVQD